MEIYGANVVELSADHHGEGVATLGHRNLSAGTHLKIRIGFVSSALLFN